jgi:predicted  nucleic acid-binding Zn-ribbon protein
VSDTPRTDSARHNENDPYMAIASECSKLERELNAANAEIEEKRKDVVWLATEKAKLENYVTELENRLRALWDKYDGDRKHYMDRIKRLEEAGDELVGSADAMEAWRKAKEAKP